jgi:uroporphyrinogen decarboxylase
MKRTGISSRQAVLDTLQGRSARVVTGPLAVHCCAALVGVSIRDYTLSATTLADCVLRYYDRFRPDAVWLSADTWVTAEAMGASVCFPGENEPLGGTGAPAIQCAADVDRIPPPDPGSRGRQPLMLEALTRIKQAIGNEVFVVAFFDQYPFSLACALLGLTQVMTKIIEDRPLVEAVMEHGLAHGQAYARALANAGADMLSGGDSPAGLTGPVFYEEIALPAERRLISAIKADCPLPVSLHICGNAAALLPGMAVSGADVLELDHLTDLALACRFVDPEITLWGNLDPVGVLAQGTAARVHAAARHAIETVRNHGRHRYVLSSGCTLPLDIPAENILALVAAARDLNREPVDA